jgi:hypothetical protein
MRKTGTHHGRSLLQAIFFVALCVVAAVQSEAFAQGAESTSSGHATPSPSEQQQRLTQEQIDYYHEQAAKLREERGFAQKVISLGSFLGAVFVALVAFVTFVFNYRATLQSQRDTQFYEALKRFGDKDSPTLRTSAAGLLAQMGKRKVGRVKGILPFNRRQPYFDASLDQLITGLQLEDNHTVLASVKDALRRLISYDPGRAIRNLYAANLALQREMDDYLVEFVAVKAENEVTKLAEVDAGVWEQAASFTPYEPMVLEALAERFSHQFPTQLKIAWRARADMDEAALIKRRGEVLEEIKAAAKRLHDNISLCAAALSLILPRRALRRLGRTKPGLNLSRIFLPRLELHAGADSEGADLEGVNFSYSCLQASVLASVNLRGVNLYLADLRGSLLSGVYLQDANMKEAQLYGAKLRNLSEDSLDGVNWTAANFFAGRDDETVDTRLIKELTRASASEYRRRKYRPSTDASLISPSMKKYISS